MGQGRSAIRWYLKQRHKMAQAIVAWTRMCDPGTLAGWSSDTHGPVCVPTNMRPGVGDARVIDNDLAVDALWEWCRTHPFYVSYSRTRIALLCDTGWKSDLEGPHGHGRQPLVMETSSPVRLLNYAHQHLDQDVAAARIENSGTFDLDSALALADRLMERGDRLGHLLAEALAGQRSGCDRCDGVGFVCVHRRGVTVPYAWRLRASAPRNDWPMLMIIETCEACSGTGRNMRGRLPWPAWLRRRVAEANGRPRLPWAEGTTRALWSTIRTGGEFEALTVGGRKTIKTRSYPRNEHNGIADETYGKAARRALLRKLATDVHSWTYKVRS